MLLFKCPYIYELDGNASKINQFNVAFNTAICRIFGFRQWQSIRQLREIYGFSSLEAMYDKAKRRFHIGMICHKNNTTISSSPPKRG